MIRTFILALVLISSSALYSQSTDSLLLGKWNLFKIIDNMTGTEILPSHKSNSDYVYYIDFFGDGVTFNLELNTCSNSYELTGKKDIEFKYYDSCSKICCDGDFSELLTYTEATKYYIKGDEVLVLVSEDRIFYFNRSE